MRWAVWLVVAASCGPVTTIGPFVKTITRAGDALAVVSCEIELQGEDLREGQCYAKTIPLSGAPIPPGLEEPAPSAPRPPPAR